MHQNNWQSYAVESIFSAEAGVELTAPEMPQLIDFNGNRTCIRSGTGFTVTADTESAAAKTNESNTRDEQSARDSDSVDMLTEGVSNMDE